MTHYVCIAVIDPGRDPEQETDDLLAPFDENLAVDPYVEETREDYIAFCRKEDRRIANDPSDRSEAHKARMRLLLSDDAFLKTHAELDGLDLNDNGDVVTTYNPNSKWDWYCTGGRFQKVYEPLQGSKAGHIADLMEQRRLVHDRVGGTPTWCNPHAVVHRDRDGNPEWLEYGNHGWFGTIDTAMTFDAWRRLLTTTLRRHLSASCMFLDMHI